LKERKDKLLSDFNVIVIGIGREEEAAAEVAQTKQLQKSERKL
jgi:hypothetical protein